MATSTQVTGILGSLHRYDIVAISQRLPPMTVYFVRGSCGQVNRFLFSRSLVELGHPWCPPWHVKLPARWSCSILESSLSKYNWVIVQRILLLDSLDWKGLSFILSSTCFRFPLCRGTRVQLWLLKTSYIHHSSHLWSQTHIYPLYQHSLFPKSCFVLLGVKKTALALAIKTHWAKRKGCALHSWNLKIKWLLFLKQGYIKNTNKCILKCGDCPSWF